jgi:hypothetical protein
MRIFEISSRKGLGMPQWLDYLADVRRAIVQDREGQERKSLVAAV